MHSKTVHTISVEPGALIAGRYEVRDRLGSGGMGVVYRCVDRDLGDVVALKLLHAHLAQDEEVFARFRNEVLVARSLSHPNIVRIHDMGRAEEGFSYISMEIVEGYSLHDRIVRRKTHPEMPTEPLTFREALEFLYQICCGVSYAHDKGIIHRDLKPANVMISTRGEVKLADFGTARIVGMDRSLTQTGQVIGTPDYMAPEQIRGEQLDSSCDIYALGIIAYELAVGQKPFIAESAVAVAFKHLNEPIPAFASPASGIPKWYEDVVRKATAKDRSQRYPSAFEFAQALCDNAPELRNKSVLFMSEQRAASQTRRDSSRSTAPSSTSESNYHLGEQSSAAGDSWVFGSYSPEAGLENPPTPTTISMRRHSPVLTGFIGTVVLFIALVFSVRLVSSLNDYVSRLLPDWEKSWGVNLQPIEGLLALRPRADVVRREPEPGSFTSVSSGNASIDLVSSSTEGSVIQHNSASSSAPAESASLEKELLAEAGIGPQVAQVSSKASAEMDSSVSSVEAVAAFSQASELSSAEPRSDSKQSSAESSVVASQSSESTSTELFAAANLSAAIILSEQKGGAAVTAFDTDKLRRSHWRAVVNGVPTGLQELVLKKLIKDSFHPRVVSVESGKIIGQVGFEIQKLPTADHPALIIAGTFETIKDLGTNSAGAYRLELLRGEQLVKSRDFSLYRLDVSLDRNNATSPGVQIVTVPTVTQEGGVGSVTPPPGAEGAVTAQPPSVTIVPPTSSFNSIPFPRTQENSVGDTLPPARRGAGEGVARQVASVPPNEGGEAQSSSLAPPVAVADVYLGRIYLDGNDNQQEGRRLELRLTFNGSDISGTASIDGLGEFGVAGKVFSRGIELNLHGPSSIRLSAGRREDTLRGRYNFGTDRNSGSWVATKRN